MLEIVWFGKILTRWKPSKVLASVEAAHKYDFPSFTRYDGFLPGHQISALISCGVRLLLARVIYPKRATLYLELWLWSFCESW